MKKGAMALITVFFVFLLFICIKSGTDKTVPDVSISEETSSTDIYEGTDSDYEKDTYEDTVYEEAPEEIMVETYPFTRLRPFSEKRAWVNFNKDGIMHTGIIDTDGKLLYESEGEFFYVSQFLDGTAFYRENSEETSSCGIIDLDGNVLFESQITPDDGYLILGYGEGHFFVIQHIQNFDTNEWRYGTIDKNGVILNEMKTEIEDEKSYRSVTYGINGWIKNEERCSVIKYIGESFIAFPVGLYNVSTACFSSFYSSSATHTYKYAKYTIGNFQDGYTIVVIDNLGASVAYVIDKDYQEPQYNIMRSISASSNSIYSEGLIWAKGYYDKDWNCVISMEKYDNAYGHPFKGGYAGITMKGADGKNYATIIDKKGDFMYSPIMVNYGNDAENGYFQVVIDGENKIIDPEGTIYTLGIDDLSMLEGLTFGDVSEGFIIMNQEEDGSETSPYYVSLDTNTIIDSAKATSTDAGMDGDEPWDDEASGDSSYIIPDSYDIMGKWKSVGDSGFGQAQPGAIVVFDGNRCNFYSPSDTYAFYFDGDKYVLDLTTPLGESLERTVNIIDDDNIKIAGASLMRIE